MEISLAGWSINRRFRNQDNPLDLLDFPKLAVEEFDIHILELNSPFFEYEDPKNQATSPIKTGYLAELRKRADDLGVQLLNIAVDGHGNMGALDETERKQAVQNHLKWIDACGELGCNSFRTNSGGPPRGEPVTDAHVQQCIKSFGELTASCQKAGLRLLMENHGGISSTPDNIVTIMNAVNSDYCRTLADFLNWPPEDDKLANLKQVAPYAWAIHGKFLSFGPDGESPEIDCAAALKILREAGYSNPYGIEYEGKTDDHEGVLKSKALLEKHA
ncbi:MAG: sugar phosphate isomerase/epimerase [bacterium]|nr:sugar phosphate isomerase/epimerase [bacterium]